MILEVVGYKGIVGNATYQWLKAMTDYEVIGRDKGDPLPIEQLFGNHTVSFVCVPEAIVEEVCYPIADYAKLIVIRSTVPPSTCQRLQDKLRVHVCHNPEFLKETTAIQDMFNPNYILIGACCQAHGSLLKGIYKSAYVRTVVTDTTTSELVKIVTNNYLAYLISFWNEIEAICNASGISGHKIGAIASLDPRVTTYGSRWHHQFGGKCLPKELDQMLRYAESIRVKTPMLEAIKEVNECQTSLLPYRPTTSKTL